MHTYERSYTDLPLEEALMQDRLYIDITRYYTQIAPCIKKVGKNNVLLLDFDELIKYT
ncbi:hypothetical protein [Porifericola rhodea]|uniref:hypothetical protein n=1 Tax=Porifericola rhodea TaxID=930972 RepID=UPI00345CB7C1